MQFGRWMLGELGSRAFPRLRRVDRPLHWRIAIRRTRVPLYEDWSTGPAVISLDQVAFRPSLGGPGDLSNVTDRSGCFSKSSSIPAVWAISAAAGSPPRGSWSTCDRYCSRRTTFPSRRSSQRMARFSCCPRVRRAAESICTAQPVSPTSWVLERRLLDFRCVDSSIFHASGSWWMMTSPQVVPGNAPITWLLRSDRITGPWSVSAGRHRRQRRAGGEGRRRSLRDYGRSHPTQPGLQCLVRICTDSERDRFLDHGSVSGANHLPCVSSVDAATRRRPLLQPGRRMGGHRRRLCVLSAERHASGSFHDDATGRAGHVAVRRRHGRNRRRYPFRRWRRTYKDCPRPGCSCRPRSWRSQPRRLRSGRSSQQDSCLPAYRRGRSWRMSNR